MSITTEAGYVERRRQALALKLAGKTYDEIAEELGYTDKGNAWRDVKKALADIPKHEANELRAVHVARLEACWALVWQALQNKDLEALAPAMKVMERQAKLLGLDAPVKSSVDAGGGLAAFLATAFPVAAAEAPQLPEPDDET